MSFSSIARTAMKGYINPQTVNMAASTISALNTATMTSNLLPRKQPKLEPTVSASLFYPEDLERYKYYISFGFSEYQRKSVFDAPFENPLENIRLPIPANIVDKISVQYSEDKMGPLVGAGLEWGIKNSGEYGGVTGAIGAGAASSILGGANKYFTDRKVNPVLQSVVSGALSGATSIAPFALQPLGLAVNPFLTVLFQSPTFKRHAFSWRLSANTIEESKKINEILKIFRQRMLPSLAVGGLLLTYPDLCTIRFHPDTDWLYKFKPCVVESITVHYAPNGQPAFFGESKAPTDIQFTVNFLETEYWLKDTIY